MIDGKIKELARRVVETLSERGKTLVTAESFTGGGITSAIVSVAGASKVLREGLVTYTVDSKALRLGIDRETVRKFGVVSKEVAVGMVRGALDSPLKPDYAVSATGNAGPSVEPDTAPCVGFVAAAGGGKEVVVKLSLTGDREENIREGVLSALSALLEIVK